MSTTTRSLAPSSTIHRVMPGVIAGIAGGLVFGLMMQTMGMIGMIAALVDSSSVAVGWAVHLAISAFSGAVFALALGAHAGRIVPAALLGLVYGAIWWVVGALLIMPAQMGMPVFELNTMAWQSLLGHLLFGLTLGVVFSLLSRDRGSAER